MQKLRAGTLITSEMLRELGACKPHIKDFEEEWPKGTTFRLKNLKRAEELGLDLDWFIDGAHDHGMIGDVKYGFIRGYMDRYWDGTPTYPDADVDWAEVDAEGAETFIRIVWKKLG